MENLKEVTIGFAAISSIVVIVFTTLLLLRKLKPVRRRYVDKPHIYVFVGFWSYVGINYLMVYAYRSAASMSDQSPEYFFDGIERGMTRMASNSMNQLIEMENLSIDKPNMNVDGVVAGETIVSNMGLQDFGMTVDGFKTKVSKARSAVGAFTDSITMETESCVSGLSVSSDQMSLVIENLTYSVETLSSETKNKKLKLQTISTELIRAFETDAVTIESGKRIKKVLNERKGVLSHLIVDLKNMEHNRKEIIADLKPRTVNKIYWIRQLTYAQIFLSLAVSFLVYIGFSRLENIMGVRWPTRICALSVPLAGANVLMFALFIGWLSVFECPAQVENIGLDKFTSKWKVSTSNSFPTRICQSSQPTIFAGMDNRHGLMITIDEVAKQVKFEVERSRSEIEMLEIYDEKFVNEMVKIKKLLHQMKQIGDGCSGTQTNSKLSLLIVEVEKMLEEGDRIQKMVNHWNASVGNGTKVLEPLVNSLLETAHKSIEFGKIDDGSAARFDHLNLQRVVEKCEFWRKIDMENLKEVTIGFAAISSIVVIVFTTLLLLRKLKPVRRRYVDKPHIYVFVGFWSYVGINYLMVYAYRSAASMSDQSPEYFFDGIERGMTRMASNSMNQLIEMENLSIDKSNMDVDGADAGKTIVSKMGLQDFGMTVDGFKTKVSKTRSAVGAFTDSISMETESCVSGLSVSSDQMSLVIGNLTDSVETLSSETKKKKLKLQTISTELIRAFETDAVTIESGKRIKKVLNERKGVLSHLIVDLKNMEHNRKEIIADLKPRTVNKIYWIRQLTYAQIFLSLAVSFLVYIGFSRLENIMGFRWPTRLCALSVPLAGANVLVFALFIGWLSVFECPAQVENIGLDSFTSKWKVSTSNSFPTRICQSSQLTIFAGMDNRHGLMITIDEVAKQMKFEIERSRSEIENLEIYDEKFVNEMVKIKKLLHKMKKIGDGCSGTQTNSKLSMLIVEVEKMLEEGDRIQKMVNHWNASVGNGTKVLEPLVNSLLETAHKSIELSIETFASKIETTDIACNSLESKIKNGRKLICMELDIQLEENWLILDAVLFLLMALFGLNVVVYRTIALWQLEHHSPTPPPPPQPVRVPRRFRARRLHANPNVF